MPVNVNPVIVNSRLVLRLETDVDEQGQSIVANRNINRLRPDASNDNIKEVAEALAGLQIYPLLGIMRVDENRLD